LAKISLTDKAYRQIREWIIHYQLKPASRLGIDELAEALGMSRTPVREALSRLAQERLVVHRPMKGFAVKALDPTEVKDLHEVRSAIEVLAARQAAVRGLSALSRKRLEEILETVPGLIDQGRKAQLLKLEQDFHVIILEASGNKPLAEIGQGVLNRIWAIQSLNILTTDQMAEAHQQHIEVVQAMAEGNSRRAASLMRKHIAYAARYILSRLNDRDDIIFSALTFNLREEALNEAR
jgi:DNA-binding GntR family transcriptional regulator